MNARQSKEGGGEETLTAGNAVAQDTEILCALPKEKDGAQGDGDTEPGPGPIDSEPNPPGPDGGPSNRASRGKRRKR